MRVARVSSSYNVTLGPVIPYGSNWARPSASVVNITVASTQALLVIRVNDDAFWGFLYTPTADSTFSVYNDCVYCLLKSKIY